MPFDRVTAWSVPTWVLISDNMRKRSNSANRRFMNTFTESHA